jgi:tryptophan synthase alpha chain
MLAAKKAGLDTIFLLAPTSTDDRIKLVAKVTQGFVYYVSLTGVTGAKLAVQNSIKDALRRIRSVTNKPIAVGFGISSPDQAAQVAMWGADGVIVGSALVKVIEENAGNTELVSRVVAFVKALKQGVLAGQGEH